MNNKRSCIFNINDYRIPFPFINMLKQFLGLTLIFFPMWVIVFIFNLDIIITAFVTIIICIILVTCILFST